MRTNCFIMLASLTTALIAGCAKKAPVTEGSNQQAPDPNSQGNTATLRQPVVVKGLSKNINWLVFSPDCTVSAVEADHGKIRLIRVADGTTVTEMTGYGEPRFAPDGQLLAVQDESGGTQFVEWKTKRVSRKIPKIPHVWFNRDWTRFASYRIDRDGNTGDETGVVVVYSASDETKIEREFKIKGLATGSGERVVDVVFHPSDKYIAARTRVGVENTAVFVWDFQTGARISLISQAAENIVFNPDGTQFALSWRQIEVWDMNSLRRIQHMPSQGRGSIRLCSDWKHALWEEQITDKRNNLISEKVHILTFPDKKEKGVATGRVVDASADGRWMLIRESDQLILYDVHAAKSKKVIDSRKNVSRAFFSPNSKIVAVPDYEGSVRFQSVDE